MITPPFISACHSMMESEVGEPRHVGGPTRHSVDPMRRGALFLPPFGAVRLLWARATSCWRPNATWRTPNTTWRARFAPFWGDSVPWNSSHVVLEAQRVMAGSQCDMACSFCALFGCFGAFGLVPRRVGGPTRHGGLPIRRGALFCSLLGCFGVFGVEPRRVGGPTRHGALPIRHGALYPLFGGFGPFGLEPRRVGGPTRHGGLPMRRGALVLLPFGPFWRLWAGATSCWRPNTTWKGTIQCDAPLSGHFNKKSHLRAKSEVAGLMLICFLVCLTCQLGR